MQASLLEQFDLIDRIDAAIDRLSALDNTPTIEQSIANLRQKRDLVADGNYVVRQVNEELCAEMGREIARLTKTSFVFMGMHFTNGVRDRSPSG